MGDSIMVMMMMMMMISMTIRAVHTSVFRLTTLCQAILRGFIETFDKLAKSEREQSEKAI